MKLSQVGRTLLSGAVFYVVAAACGSSDQVGGVVADGGGLDGVIDVIGDAVMDPVSEAHAADVATESCSVAGTVGPQSATYAVHAYPGKTVTDLAMLHVVAHNVTANQQIAGGVTYDHVAAIPLLRDGFAAVECSVATTQFFDSVTFVLP